MVTMETGLLTDRLSDKCPELVELLFSTPNDLWELCIRWFWPGTVSYLSGLFCCTAVSQVQVQVLSFDYPYQNKKND